MSIISGKEAPPGEGGGLALRSKLRALGARSGVGRLPRVRPLIWRTLTLLTCPCCIPIWAAVLSGTAAGALLTRNIYLTIAVVLVMFLFSARKAVRSYDGK